MVHDMRENLDEEQLPGPHSRGVKELRDSKSEWLALLEEWIERHSRR
jgi:hypothetical protein